MVKVVVANRLVRDDKTYKGGDIVDLPPGEARELRGLGKVRPHVDPKPAAEPTKPETKGAKNG